jgi:hypothetical protein
MRGVWWGWRLVGRGEDALHRKRGIEVCALPPSRQKPQEAGPSTPLRYAQDDNENGARCFYRVSGAGSFQR